MAAVAKTAQLTVGSFGFDPDESTAFFLVQIPTSTQKPVEISEHLTWDPDHLAESVHYGTARTDGEVRCRLARAKWNEIADVLRPELNLRLRAGGKRPGRWKSGNNFVSRTLGKEVTLLAWAIEDADPSLIPIAVANWKGLSPEERWWLYTMTAAATGNHASGRGRGWRKAVRFALTENPTAPGAADRPVVPEFFRVAAAVEGNSTQLPLLDTPAAGAPVRRRKSRRRGM